MYLIVSVIVGIPITPEMSRLVEDWEAEGDERWKEWEEYGFETLYHGGSPYTIGFCGVEIGEFDECRSSMRLLTDGDRPRFELDAQHDDNKECFLTALKSQRDEALRLVREADSEIVKVAPPFGEYLIFHSS